MIRAIAHPTDFSPGGEAAFACALRLALVNRCELFLLHVHGLHVRNEWHSFPRVRDTLERWGRLEPGSTQGDVHPRTGVAVTKFEIRDSDASDGLSRFLQEHRPDLIVMASRGNTGLKRSLSGSVTADVVRAILVPTLVLGPQATSFVDVQTGALKLANVLLPVDHDPAPAESLASLETLTGNLDVTFDLLHVGAQPPVVRDSLGTPRSVRTVDGPVVETIIAESRGADLIAMPVAGRDGLMDALLGSTSERVVSEARCPVLALPVAPA